MVVRLPPLPSRAPLRALKEHRGATTRLLRPHPFRSPVLTLSDSISRVRDARKHVCAPGGSKGGVNAALTYNMHIRDIRARYIAGAFHHLATTKITCDGRVDGRRARWRTGRNDSFLGHEEGGSARTKIRIRSNLQTSYRRPAVLIDRRPILYEISLCIDRYRRSDRPYGTDPALTFPRAGAVS